MTRLRPISLCALALALAACSRDEPAATPPPPEAVDEPAAPAPAQPEALLPSGHDVFGMALPSGVQIEDEREGIRHYRTSSSWNELMSFFDLNLEGAWTLTRFDRGARLVADDGSERAIYLYRETMREPWLLSYFETREQTGIGGRETFATPRDNPNWADSIEARFGDERATASIGDGSLVPASARGGGGGDVPPDSPLFEPGPVNARFHTGDNPRLRDRVGLERAQTPINFVRGIREEKQNPDALF